MAFTRHPFTCIVEGGGEFNLDMSVGQSTSLAQDFIHIFEKLLYYQLCDFFEDKLSIFQCGFRKGFSAQHCLIPLLEKWRAAVDNR